MEKFFNNIINKSREFRNTNLKKPAEFLIKIKITPNILTTLSLISGLLAVYFLFNHYLYFLIFTLIHFLADAFDGVVARLTKPTLSGKYFDHLSDNLVAFLILIKVGQFLGDLYPYLVAGLYALGLIIHFTSQFGAPMIFIRTSALILLIVATFPYFPAPEILITVGYLVAGGTTVFSLARQLQFFLKRFL